VKWEIALKPRVNIYQVSNLYYHRKESVKDRLNPKKNKPLSKNRDLCVIKTKIIGPFM
jgi:hypothetical protein